MLADNSFYISKYLSIEKICELIKSDSYLVIIWGTGDYALNIYNTLESYGLNIDFFGDNNEQRMGLKINNKLIIGINEIDINRKWFVISGSIFFDAIYKQLSETGIKNIFAMKECLKYPLKIHIHERKILSKYFTLYNKKISNRILLDVYGFIGDIIIKFKIFKAIIHKYGYENVYFLCDNNYGSGIKDLLQIISNNIIEIDHKLFNNNFSYRINKLRYINGMYFKQSISICGLDKHSSWRLLNYYNFNTTNIIVNEYLHIKTYMLKSDINFANKIMNNISINKLYPKGCINKKISNINFEYYLPSKYVVLGIGAANKLRYYPPEKFAKVTEALIHMNFRVAVIGYGVEDEKYFTEMLSNIKKDTENIINFISLLKIHESLCVIKKAKLFVGVESGMWNASYVLDVPSVVIYGGGDYGGFKHKDKKIKYISKKEMNCFNCRWWCTNKTENGTAKCIDEISTKNIIKAIKQLNKKYIEGKNG